MSTSAVNGAPIRSSEGAVVPLPFPLPFVLESENEIEQQAALIKIECSVLQSDKK